LGRVIRSTPVKLYARELCSFNNLLDLRCGQPACLVPHPRFPDHMSGWRKLAAYSLATVTKPFGCGAASR